MKSRLHAEVIFCRRLAAPLGIGPGSRATRTFRRWPFERVTEGLPTIRELSDETAFPATYRYPYHGCDRKAGLDERFGLSAPVEPLSLFSR
jgi:hypothetical protein